MVHLITKVSLFILFAATMAYNPHDPNDPVMFVRRLRADSRSLNSDGINNKRAAPQQEKESPNRNLESNKRPYKRSPPARRDLNTKRSPAQSQGTKTILSVGSNTTQASCKNNCGEGLDNCFCDDICQNLGDCCDDVCDACGFCAPVPTFEPGTFEPSFPGATADPSDSTCAGNCGQALAGCFCDDICQNLGDCCDDVCDECGFCAPVATLEPSSFGTFPGGADDPSSSLGPTSAPTSTPAAGGLT